MQLQVADGSVITDGQTVIHGVEKNAMVEVKCILKNTITLEYQGDDIKVCHLCIGLYTGTILQ